MQGGGHMQENKEWSQLWLKYEKKNANGNEKYAGKVILGQDQFDSANPVIKNALSEFVMGCEGMLGITPVITNDADVKTSEGLVIKRVEKDVLSAESYSLEEAQGVITLSASDAVGVLYGVFAILRMIARQKTLQGIKEESIPNNPLRMINHWDNMDGSIERGYSGRSFFFVNNEVVVDERVKDFARFVASVGLNGVVINNVNVKNWATYLITDKYFDKMQELSELFASYGIRMFLSLNYAASIELGGLDSADPLDPSVRKWWEGKMAEVFTKIPHLGGFLVKADSEGRPGPFTYGRTQADGANMLADIVKPYGALIIWRCFVYNCTQDWRDYKTDRARAGYDNFIKMDGDYHDNVILQIKNGPMDFQIREPISPLLGGLSKTNQMLEVQVAQEYTGHQIDVCYLIPMFKEILDFHTYCKEGVDTVADVISGRTLGNKNCGIAAVINTGNDRNWTGNDLAAVNFYGYGRLAFNTSLTAEEIAREWIEMTYSTDEKVVKTILEILLPSREIYERYTSPLGIGWMVTPHEHYGCSVDGYEYSRWGTYHRADHLGLGVDRSDKGTGYALQYHEPNASMYNKMETCPEELLLFFHHVPYTYKLKTGKTLIQHIYDSHFQGVEEVEEMIPKWESLKGLVPEDSYNLVRERFDRQLYNAKEWRDQVNSYFYRKSGIADEKGRAIY